LQQGQQRPRRQHAHHHRHHPREFLITTAKVLGSVEVAEEKLRCRPVALAGKQIRISASQACRLPFLEYRVIRCGRIGGTRSAQFARHRDARRQFTAYRILVQIVIHFGKLSAAAARPR
jgi:hypothetical protein